MIDHIRDLKEFKTLFNERPMEQDLYSFDFIINNPHLYCFYEEGKLLGFIFIAKHGKRLFLSGTSVRKNLPYIINGIEQVCGAYDQPMYSDTDKREAAIALRKAGFKRIKNTNYYKRSK